jgi:arylsulfatase A
MADNPNIILIVADDMGYGDCGCFGSETIKTPNIDALGREGIRFTDFHSNGAVCSPTRAALLTGKYQQRCGIEGVITAANHRHVGLPLEETTFADALSANDYRTALFGKWHLGYERQFNPCRRGFDEFNGFVSGNIDYRSHIDQIGEVDWWNCDELVPEDGYTTDLVTEHGVRFIRENGDSPFCLYLAHECPHYPYQGPDDDAFRAPGNPDPIQGPRQDQTEAYREMMECMDAGIGRIVDTVKSCGMDANTLIFFFSDNGPSGPGSAGPLRGGKGSVWEGGHRIPAVARWPGKIPAGSETDTPCIGMDLFPTMMAVAGVDPPAGLTFDGEDIMSLMAGTAASMDRDLFWRHGNQRAVRSDKWKLVMNGRGGEELELFDLDNDLAESENLVADQSGIADELRGKLVAWERDVSSDRQLT